MSGRFSAPPAPRKRSPRHSLSLYLDFPLMSALTLAACVHFPLSPLPSSSPGTSTSAAHGIGGDDDNDDDDDG